jgi:hypothetical protein
MVSGLEIKFILNFSLAEDPLTVNPILSWSRGFRPSLGGKAKRPVERQDQQIQGNRAIKPFDINLALSKERPNCLENES